MIPFFPIGLLSQSLLQFIKCTPPTEELLLPHQIEVNEDAFRFVGMQAKLPHTLRRVQLFVELFFSVFGYICQQISHQMLHRDADARYEIFLCSSSLTFCGQTECRCEKHIFGVCFLQLIRRRESTQQLQFFALQPKDMGSRTYNIGRRTYSGCRRHSSTFNRVKMQHSLMVRQLRRFYALVVVSFFLGPYLGFYVMLN